jgi:hypothetical protein
MSRTLTTAIATGRALVDGLMHFAIASIVTFSGVNLALPIVMQALRTAGVG